MPRAPGAFFLPGGTHGPLARLPHPPRRSSASLLPSPLLPRGRERGRRLRARIAVAGARGGGGARGCLVSPSGSVIRGVRGRALRGGRERGGRGGRSSGFVPAGTRAGTCGTAVRSHLSANPRPLVPCAVSVQLPPDLGLFQLPAIRIYFGNVSFLVFFLLLLLTIILLSPRNSCVNLVRLRRRHYAQLKAPFQLPTLSDAMILVARGRNA